MDTPDPVTKPAAIAFCDIVDFSQLVGAEGDLAAANILRVYFDRVSQLAKENDCATIKFIGDGCLATFENVDDAMSVIVGIQRLLAESGPLAERQLAVSFSLNFGDVVYMETSYGPDVFGEQVNIAAHLNGLACGHQLVISQAAFDRLPSEMRSRAGASETHSFKRAGTVQFHRIDLAPV